MTGLFLCQLLMFRKCSVAVWFHTAVNVLPLQSILVFLLLVFFFFFTTDFLRIEVIVIVHVKNVSV